MPLAGGALTAVEWTVDAYETETGEKPAWRFLDSLEGRDLADAYALLKALREHGNALRRPHSAALEDGLFELRGKQVRLFYIFLPGRTARLLDGEIKKRNDIPAATLTRIRKLQKDALRRYQERHRRKR